MRKTLPGSIHLFLIGFSFSMMMLLTATEAVTFNNSHFDRMFHRYEISKVTGLETTELSAVIQDVLAYLKDDRVILDTTVTSSDGFTKAAFGERALLHMLDVKNLFVKGRLIRAMSVITFISLVTYLITKDKSWHQKLSSLLFRTAGVNLLLILLFYLLIQTNFYQYFTYFHLIFFSNDLWLLDPSTELLIQMLPEALFFDTVSRIILIYVSIQVVTGILSWLGAKRNAAITNYHGKKLPLKSLHS